jgi:hypothetical protein
VLDGAPDPSLRSLTTGEFVQRDIVAYLAVWALTLVGGMFAYSILQVGLGGVPRYWPDAGREGDPLRLGHLASGGSRYALGCHRGKAPMGIAYIGREPQLMTDEASLLTRINVREEAREILSAIDASRRQRPAFEAHWRRLWQLAREAEAAYLPPDASDTGPWELRNEGGNGNGASSTLTAGDFTVPVWPPEAPRLETHLPGLLNWAGVPVPKG